jgi:hypothetical protein
MDAKPNLIVRNSVAPPVVGGTAVWLPRNKLHPGSLARQQIQCARMQEMSSRNNHNNFSSISFKIKYFNIFPRLVLHEVGLVFRGLSKVFACTLRVEPAMTPVSCALGKRDFVDSRKPQPCQRACVTQTSGNDRARSVVNLNNSRGRTISDL